MSVATAPHPFGTIRLFHPRGPAVTLPVPAGTADAFDYSLALHAVSAALDAGWLSEAPGLTPGEEKEEIGYVLIREKENRDNSISQIAIMYSTNDLVKFKVFTHYLDTKEQREEFEAVSGLKLKNLEVYQGTSAPERGKSRMTDKFIYKAPRPFTVVLAPNPLYNPDEPDVKKRKAKHVFVRYQSAGSTPAAGTEPAADEGKLIESFNAFLASDPPLADFNEYLRTIFGDMPKTVQDQIRKPLAEHAKSCDWTWDRNRGEYVAPAPAGDTIPF